MMRAEDNAMSAYPCNAFAMRATAMTLDLAKDIAGWRYGGEYAMYDFDGSDELIAKLMGGGYVACVDEAGALLGYLCFGADARIPTREANAYQGGWLDIGLGLRPELCGRGLGASLVQLGISLCRERGCEAVRRALDKCEGSLCGLRLTVAEFNMRARRLYERMGFAKDAQVCHRMSGMRFIVMTRGI